MATDPDKISRTTGTLGLPIYARGATVWDEAVNDIADRVDGEASSVRTRLNSLESTADGLPAMQTEASNAAASAADAADSAAAAAQSADDAAAVVTGGTATTTPTAGKIPLADSQALTDLGWRLPVMTRAEWEAGAARNRDRYAGSGFVEWGKGQTSDDLNVNEGLSVQGGGSGQANLFLGRTLSAAGVSRTGWPVVNVNGAALAVQQARNGAAANPGLSAISFPTAPADSSLLSCQDLVFLEVWHEAITDKDVVYPYGNVQYGATTWNGVSLTQPEPASYSAFGAWEASPVAGYGLAWASASAADKKTFTKDPQNNIYEDDGALVQARYRIRVVRGLGDAWTSVNGNQSQPRYSSADDYVKAQGLTTSLDSDTTSTASLGYNTNNGEGDRGGMYNATAANSYTDKTFFIPIAIIQRRNSGAFHPTFNPDGCARFVNVDAVTAAYWYDTDQTITSAAECFTYSYGDGAIADGTTGRPDGLYYDKIAADDVQDLRNNSNRVDDMQRVMEREFRKLVAGDQRGYEGYRKVVETVTATPTAKADAGLQIRIDFAASTFTEFTDSSLYSGSASAVFSTDNKANAIIIDSAGNPFAAVWLRDSTNDELYLHHVHGDTTSVIDITGDCTVLVLDKADHKAETLLHCDIIGDPANYPSDFTTTGVYGSPLCVAEDGSSLLPADVASTDRKSWKLSRKITGDSDVQAVYHWDGATWAALSNGTADGNWDIDATNNEIDLHEDTWGTTFTDSDVWLVFYETAAFVPSITTNPALLSRSDVMFSNDKDHAPLISGLIGKVAVNDSSDFGHTLRKYVDAAGVLSGGVTDVSTLTGTGPAVKVETGLFVENGKAKLLLTGREMINDTTDYGDTATETAFFSDNLTTDTDDNAATVLKFSKAFELQSFILDVE